MKARPPADRKKTTSGRSTGRSANSSGGSILGGIILFGVLGLGVLGYIGEHILPALAQNWPWVIWYILSVIIAFGAVIVRARTSETKYFLPELLIAILLIVKVSISDFWVLGTQTSPTLVSLFLLSSACVCIVFFFYHRRPWFSNQVYGSRDNELSWPITATLVTLFVLVLIAVFAAWITAMPIWDIWPWAKALILPIGVVILPYWVAYYLRVSLVTERGRKKYN